MRCRIRNEDECVSCADAECRTWHRQPAMSLSNGPVCARAGGPFGGPRFVVAGLTEGFEDATKRVPPMSRLRRDEQTEVCSTYDLRGDCVKAIARSEQAEKTSICQEAARMLEYRVV